MVAKKSKYTEAFRASGKPFHFVTVNQRNYSETLILVS